MCIKSGYVISAKWKPPQGSAQGGQLETLDAVAVGFYWACGACGVVARAPFAPTPLAHTRPPPSLLAGEDPAE